MFISLGENRAVVQKLYCFIVSHDFCWMNKRYFDSVEKLNQA